MPSCGIRFSGFRRRAHPGAQTAARGATHLPHKGAPIDQQEAPACRKLESRRDSVSVLFQHANRRSSAHGSNGLFNYLFPLSTEYTDVLYRSAKQVCNRVIEPLSASVWDRESSHASELQSGDEAFTACPPQSHFSTGDFVYRDMQQNTRAARRAEIAVPSDRSRKKSWETTGKTNVHTPNDSSR